MQIKIKEKILEIASVPLCPRKEVIRSAYLKQTQRSAALAIAANEALNTLITFRLMAVPIAVVTAIAPGPNVSGSVSG